MSAHTWKCLDKMDTNGYICLYPSPIQFNVKKIPVTEKTEMWQNGAKLK